MYFVSFRRYTFEQDSTHGNFRKMVAEDCFFLLERSKLFAGSFYDNLHKSVEASISKWQRIKYANIRFKEAPL